MKVLLGVAFVVAGALVATLPAATAASKPTVHGCVEAWNRAPAALRASTVRRHPEDVPAQLIAGTATGSGPVCALLFRSGATTGVLVTGRWSAARVDWSTSVGPMGELAAKLQPDDFGTVVFARDGTLGFPSQEGPTREQCVRDWNRRPLAQRLVLARARPSRVMIGPGRLAIVRDGVLRMGSATGCRAAFLLADDTFELVFGVWGKEGRVTAWTVQPNPAGPLELYPMRQGHASAVVRQNGTLRLIRQ